MSPKTSARQKLAVRIYYVRTALRDSWGSRGTLATTAVILAGICLIILLLGGLKNGLVAKIRNDILKSPTATLIQWWAPSADLALDKEGEIRLQARWPRKTTIVPEITRLATLRLADGSEVKNITLQTTTEDDPYLGFYEAGISGEKAQEVVISASVAKALGIVEQPDGRTPAGKVVELFFSRNDEHGITTVSTEVTLRCVLPNSDKRAMSGFLPRYLMDKVEDFSQGKSVPEFGWPGRVDETSFGYGGYLVFTKTPFTVDDFNRLHLRGLRAVDVDELDSPVAHDCETLFGTLRPHELQVYRITAETQNDPSEMSLDFGLKEVEDITPTDDVAFFWSEPVQLQLGGRERTMVGMTGSTRWLRKHLRSPELRFVDDGLFQVILPEVGNAGSNNCVMKLQDGTEIRLERIGTPIGLETFRKTQLVTFLDAFVESVEAYRSYVAMYSETLELFDIRTAWRDSDLRTRLHDWETARNRSRRAIAFVPASLVSAVHLLRRGEIAFDGSTQSFSRVHTPNKYFAGRIYASSLDDVPELDDMLQNLGYNTVSNRTRVEEMHGYMHSLDLLVRVATAVAIIVGVFTVFVVFMDLTRRRRTSIGIMRIMGMERLGIFIFVFMRAFIIGVMGWAIATISALVAGIALPYFFNAECRFHWVDFAQVLVGAVVCSILGVIFHAWHAATRLDPVHAITSGKVQ